MIKIFYNKSSLILSEKPSDKPMTKINFSDKEAVKNELKLFLDTNNHTLLNIYGLSANEYHNFFTHYFKFIIAAGGIVINSSNEILLIERLGYNDLPKGKTEENETTLESAVREVSEECGININDLQNVAFFDKTYHIYFLKNNFVIKETHWFTMSFRANYTLKPQTEENISKVFWANKNEITNLYKNMYPALVELLEKYFGN
ncbi:MAG: NUDIX domain-containing protein [Bacteroidales bacterium]|nr:NUDIX domain-containing protein [Bacteroidales bacterium]